VICFALVAISISSCGYKTNPRPSVARIPVETRTINADVFPDRIVLKWVVPTSNTDGSSLTDLSGFKVYRGSRGLDEDCEDCHDKRELYANIDFQAPSNARISGNEVIFEDEDVSPGNIYSYAVAAYNLRGRDSANANALEVHFEAPPPAPTNLVAKAEEGHIRLEWKIPEEEKIDRYQILRGTEKDVSRMKEIGSASRREPWFVDKELEKNTKYFYVVRSVKSTRGTILKSAPSVESAAVAPGIYWGAPEDVNVAMTRQGVRVYWNPVKIENEETFYNVYRSESGGVFKKVNPEPLKNSWFLDTRATKGREYRYAVAAFAKNRPDEESARTASEALKYNY
jgi:hypothetical protein